MQYRLRVILIAALGATTAACGSLKEDLGLLKEAPDEFAVVRNAPLSLPPDFNLRPPKPGEVGDGRLEQRDQARALLVRDRGRSTRQATAATLASASAVAPSPQFSFVAGRSGDTLGELRQHAAFAGGPRTLVASATATRGGDPGERALLGRLDAVNPDPNIRRRVDEEARLLSSDDRSFVERLMFWRKLNPPGVLVEPKGEQSRINANSALGKSVTDGETPEIRVERLSDGFSGIKLF